jgi:MYXO-CTERM domain-containing protein
MKKWVLVGLFAAMTVGMAHADVVTLEENDINGTPVIDLSSIVGQWGTPSDSTSEFTVGGSGTDGVAGLYIVNNLGFTITSLQVFVYGTYSTTADSTLKYQCGVNNFFNACTPSTQQVLPDPSTISQSSPIEFDYFCTGTCTGITEGTEFQLLDSVDGTLGSATRLFYQIDVNGDPPAAAPEPASVAPAGVGLLAMGLLLAFRRRKTSSLSV